MRFGFFDNFELILKAQIRIGRLDACTIIHRKNVPQQPPGHRCVAVAYLVSSGIRHVIG